MKAPFFTTGEYEEKTMGRRELRESIFQLLFMTEFNDNQEMAEQKQLYLETIEAVSYTHLPVKSCSLVIKLDCNYSVATVPRGVLT